MSFDLSRKQFNALDDYFGVVMQQGRVQLDADWNELVDQFTRRMRAESLDTFGGAVVPRVTPDGFLVSGPVTAFEIGPGRIYVDGLLAENHTETVKWDARLAEVCRGLVQLAQQEDLHRPAGCDLTTASLVPSDRPGKAAFIAREDIVVAGLPVIGEVANQYSDQLNVEFHVDDGDTAQAGSALATAAGPAADL